MNRRAPRSPTPRPGQGNQVSGVESLNGLCGGIQYFDILPAMNGGDSYGVPAGFTGISGFLPQPPYFSGGLRRGSTFGLSARRSLDAKNIYYAEKKGNRLTRLTPPRPPRRPGLALTMGSNGEEDRKSTRLNSSHGYISYAVFCLKKKNQHACMHAADRLKEWTRGRRAGVCLAAGSCGK